MEPNNREELLNKYVTDMVALTKHIQEAFARQLADADMQKHTQAHSIITQAKAVLDAQHEALHGASSQLNAEGLSATKEAVTAVLGFAAGMYDKIRAHAVSKMLRDDYVVLTLTCVAYEMLHTTGLAARHDMIAQLSLKHLKELTPFVMQIGQALPEVVVKEIAGELQGVDMQAAQVAARNNQEAWKIHGNTTV